MMASQLTFQGMPPKPRADLSQWFTHPKLAERIVRWALEGKAKFPRRILEPSAGSGSFVDPLVRLVGGNVVTAVELDPPWAEHLQELHPLANVVAEDFLQWDCQDHFELSVMNPPYEGGQDGTHVARTLALCDQVVALVRVVFLNGVDRHRDVWSKTHLQGIRWFTDRPCFSGAGSPRHDFVVVKLGVDPVDSVDVGWWNSLGGEP